MEVLVLPCNALCPLCNICSNPVRKWLETDSASNNVIIKTVIPIIFSFPIKIL